MTYRGDNSASRQLRRACPVTALGAARVQGANVATLRLGFIGLGNWGDQVLDGFQHRDAEVVAICDLHQPYLDFAARRFGSSPRQFKDYRRLLELKDIDAVTIGTPHHWHTLMGIQASKPGKDYLYREAAFPGGCGRAHIVAKLRAATSA